MVLGTAGHAVTVVDNLSRGNFGALVALDDMLPDERFRCDGAGRCLRHGGRARGGDAWVWAGLRIAVALRKRAGGGGQGGGGMAGGGEGLTTKRRRWAPDRQGPIQITPFTVEGPGGIVKCRERGAGPAAAGKRVPK